MKVAFDPEKVVVHPEKVAFDPEKVVVHPEKVAFDPEKVAFKNSSPYWTWLPNLLKGLKC